MKQLISFVLLLTSVFQCVSGSFRDLDFEEANTNNVTAVPGDGAFAPLGDLLPGWMLRVPPNILVNPNDIIGYNNRIDGRGNITLVDRSHTSAAEFAPAIEGNYYFAIAPLVDDVTHEILSDSLFQVGDVPSDAKSIQFYSPLNPFELRADNIILPLVQISSNPKFFGADISAFAGESVELKFTTLPGPFLYNVIDAISFSSIQIPEPSAVALIGVGCLTLLFGKRLSRR